MEKRINKEIREYKESIAWGLSMRQFLFSLLGILISVGIYFILKDSIGTEAVSWACIFGMLPCAIMGFVTYNKMPAEKFLWELIKSEVLTPKNLTCKPYNLYYEVYLSFSESESINKRHSRKVQNKSARRKQGKAVRDEKYKKN